MMIYGSTIPFELLLIPYNIVINLMYHIIVYGLNFVRNVFA